MAGWIDFKKLRQSLLFEKVLSHYGVELQIKGEQHVGQCPLPTHGKGTGTSSFSANLGRGIWQCFGCKASGNALDFCVRMQGFDVSNPESFREGAARVQEVFSGNPENKEQLVSSERKVPDLPVVVNAPLDFELKGLDSKHPSIGALGLSEKTIAFFGLGYASKGLMEGRIAFPLHDKEGRRIGYGGRIADETKATPENPLYLLPSRRERKGTVHEFDPTRFLYNGHSFKRPVKRLIVVQDFESVWWLRENGYVDSIAVMGETIGGDQEVQALPLVSPKGVFHIVSENTEAGEKFGRNASSALAAWKPTRWLRIPEGKRFVDCERLKLEAILKQGEP